MTRRASERSGNSLSWRIGGGGGSDDGDGGGGGSSRALKDTNTEHQRVI